MGVGVRVRGQTVQKAVIEGVLKICRIFLFCAMAMFPDASFLLKRG